MIGRPQIEFMAEWIARNTEPRAYHNSARTACLRMADAVGLEFINKVSGNKKPYQKEEFRALVREWDKELREGESNDKATN